MSREVALQFMIWSYYYHDIMPASNMSYKDCGRFADEDVKRLDDFKSTLLKTFEESTVQMACKNFDSAKNDPSSCPFTQSDLDAKFAKEK